MKDHHRLALLALLALTVACRSTAEAPAPDATTTPVVAGDASRAVPENLNARFLSEDLDVQEFVDIFEGESREVAQSVDAIVATLELRAGMAVADVGAGTGLFLEPLASGVGRGGRLLAVDISPGFLEHLEDRIEAAGLRQAETVLCTERSVELPPASVDVALVCDTYHHFAYPNETLASLHRALRPGGRLVVVDFERIPGVTRQWLLDHVRAGKDVFRAEIEAAGFRLLDEPDVDGLEENYVLRFVRS